MAATYEQAYATLKSAGWDDEKINASLAKKGLYPGGNGGGGNEDKKQEEVGADMIKEYKTPEGETKSYDEQKADEGDAAFKDLTGITTKEDEDEDKDVVDGGMSAGDAAKVSVIVQEAIKNGVSLGKLSGWLKAGGNGILKALGWTSKFALRNAGAIAAGLASAYETEQDRKNGVLKADYINGDEGAGAYWKDVGRNFYGYADNLLFGALPNTDWAYNKAEGDGWYGPIHSNDAQKEQKKALKKNKEVKETDKQMKDYWKEIKAADKYGSNIGNDADAQINRLLIKKGIRDQELQSAYKADLIKKGYKIKEVKDAKGNTVYTWVKDGKPLFMEV